jgi:uncharacterized protein (DUF1330 family)
MSTIKSNPDQFKKLAKNPVDSPVVMLNLLKYKADGGKSSYLNYMKEAAKFVEGVGGKVLYLGAPDELLNGEEVWDLLMLVQYPSRKAFIQMTNNPDYLTIHEFREEGIERAVLYATDPVTFKDLSGKSRV